MTDAEPKWTQNQGFLSSILRDFPIRELLPDGKGGSVQSHPCCQMARASRFAFGGSMH